MFHAGHNRMTSEEQPLDLRVLKRSRLNCAQERTPAKKAQISSIPPPPPPQRHPIARPVHHPRRITSALYISTEDRETSSSSICSTTANRHGGGGGLLQSALLRPLVVNQQQQPLNLSTTSTSSSPTKTGHVHSDTTSSAAVSLGASDEAQKQQVATAAAASVKSNASDTSGFVNRMSYPREFKLMVIEYFARNGHNKYRTCKQFGITKSMLNGWLAKIDKIRESRPGSLKSGRSGRRPQFPSVEKQLHALYTQQLALGQRVGNKWLRDTARLLAQQQCSYAQLSGMCQFSERWLSNFKKRFGVNLNRDWTTGSHAADTSSVSSADPEDPDMEGEEDPCKLASTASTSSTIGSATLATSTTEPEEQEPDLDSPHSSLPTTNSSFYPISDTSRSVTPTSESDLKIDVDDSFDGQITAQITTDCLPTSQPSAPPAQHQPPPASTPANPASSSNISSGSSGTANLVNQTPATFGNFNWLPTAALLGMAMPQTGGPGCTSDGTGTPTTAPQPATTQGATSSFLHSVPPNYEPGRRGRKVQFPQVERVLYDRLMVRQAGGHRVSNRWLQEQARLIAQQMCPKVLAEATKSARCMFSEHWLHNFKKRYNVTLKLAAAQQQQQQPTNSQNSSGNSTGLISSTTTASCVIRTHPLSSASAMPLRPTPVKHQVADSTDPNSTQQHSMQHWLLQQALMNSTADSQQQQLLIYRQLLKQTLGH